MKKLIATILFVFIVVFYANAQERHRWHDEPYDIFLSVRGSFILPQDNFKDNYDWGAGGKIVTEWQYEDIQLSWGLSLGYNRYQPKYLKIKYLPTKQLFVAQEVPITLFANYYLLNNSIKPYVGIGVSAMWGKYDYSFSKLSNTYTTGRNDNFNEYLLREFEVESGFKFGVIPHLGIMISTNHKHGFGLEVSMDYYLERSRLEKQLTYGVTLYYTYIID